MERLREKIGQMFLVGCGGETLTREERSIFAKCQFGGFILFRDNCVAPSQIVQLCRSLWQAALEFPPFIAIDHEGGIVQRLPEPFTRFPPAARIGGAGNADLAHRLGRAAAEELRLAGINLNFAPVLDVGCNAANPIVGDRAFGTDAAAVIEFGSAWMLGLIDGGIIPCGKHFPGHGGADQDSHLELPTVMKSSAELSATELLPFAHACRSRIDSLMTAHVRYPALDPRHPATLSEPIVTGLLRHQYGYDGVVFSDDMEMKAISGNYGVEESAALAVRAGVDVVLFCHDAAKATRAFEFLCHEAERDPELRARVESSFQRITTLKQRCLKNFTGAAEAEIEARLGALRHQRLIDEIQGNL